MTSLKIKKRMDVIAAFHPNMNKALAMSSHMKTVRIGCDCGCGGHDISKEQMELADLGFSIRNDIFDGIGKRKGQIISV